MLNMYYCKLCYTKNIYIYNNCKWSTCQKYLKSFAAFKTTTTKTVSPFLVTTYNLQRKLGQD